MLSILASAPALLAGQANQCAWIFAQLERAVSHEFTPSASGPVRWFVQRVNRQRLTVRDQVQHSFLVGLILTQFAPYPPVRGFFVEDEVNVVFLVQRDEANFIDHQNPP